MNTAGSGHAKCDSDQVNRASFAQMQLTHVGC